MRRGWGGGFFLGGGEVDLAEAAASAASMQFTAVRSPNISKRDISIHDRLLSGFLNMPFVFTPSFTNTFLTQIHVYLFS